MEQKNRETKKPIDVTKKDQFAGIKRYLKKRPPKKRLIIVSSASVLVLIAGSLYAFTQIKPDQTLNPEPEVVSTYVAPPPTFTSPLTGLLTDEESSNRRVTGIMIENSIDARPQSGLEEAGIVFEAIAEGGITRFLALYQEAKPANIGPIRSARPYYVRWVAGYDAAYVHSGGSGEALALIRTLGVKDLDQGRFGEQIASRVSSRFAPHNVFTSMERIDSVASSQGYISSDFTPFIRKEATPPTVESPITAKNISFDISGANYNTSYAYRAETNDYARVMAGLPHKDQDSGKQITPEVIIALEMTYGYHPNGVHGTYDNIGSGSALIFQDGRVIEATWKKSEDKSSLKLTDSKGKDIELNPGQTWITAIPPGRTSYTL